MMLKSLVNAQKLAQQKKYAEAEIYFKRAIIENPDKVDIYYQWAEMCLKLGRFSNALQLGRKALNVDPEHGKSQAIVGNLLALGNHIDAAIPHLEKATQLAVRDPSVLYNLGTLYLKTGAFDKAIGIFNKCQKNYTKDPEYHLNFAWSLFKAGETNKALKHFDKAVALSPREQKYLYGYGLALMSALRWEKACKIFSLAEKNEPKNIDVIRGLSRSLEMNGDFSAALAKAKFGLAFVPDDKELNFQYGKLLTKRGQHHKALPYLEKAFENGFPNIDYLCTCYDALRRPEKSTALVKSILEVKQLDDLKRAQFLTTYGKYIRMVGHKSELDFILNEIEGNPYKDIVLLHLKAEGFEIELDLDYLTPEKETLLTFYNKEEGIAKYWYLKAELLNKDRKYEEAMICLIKAHEEAVNDEKRENFAKFVDESVELFTGEFVQKRIMTQQVKESVQPIFIIGMPRSGTTLLEKTLERHNRIAASGELEFLGNYISENALKSENTILMGSIMDGLDQAGLTALREEYLERLTFGHPNDVSYVIDKMPHNFSYVGLIMLMFPEAKILHCCRHPVATCFSIYQQSFNSRHAYAHKQDELGAYYLDYRRLMAHWKKLFPENILDVEYENFVLDQEKVIRQILDFIGLEWEQGILKHNDSAFSMTASSKQVQKSLYSDAIEHWRHYEAGLKPLIDALKPAL